MKFIHYLKKSCRFFDMFYSSEMLRYNHDPQHKTVAGGIITLSIVVMVFVGFGNMIRDTLNKTAITSNLDKLKTNEPSFYNLTADADHMFMFGINIVSMDLKTTLNLATGPRYFDVILRTVNVKNGVIAGIQHYDLVQCTDDHWSMFPSVVKKAKIYNYSNWLCPKIGQAFPLQGSYTSPNQYITNMQILPCSNSSNKERPCVSQSEINNFFTKNPNSYFSVFYINPVITPSQTHYIDHYLEGNQNVIFSKTQGSEAWIYFSKYQITTDNSIWPFSQQFYQSGAIVEQKAIVRSFLNSQWTGLANIYFSRSYNTLIYQRYVQKLTSVFSYIGGLVGAVTAVLFLLRAYTATSLELTIAFGLFQDSVRQGISQKAKLLDKYAKSPSQHRYFLQNSGMSIFHYAKLKIYRFCKFFNITLNWKHARVLYDFQYEILHQLDVNILIRRLIGLETCMSYLFEKHQLEGIKNQRQINLMKARGLRQQLVLPDELQERHQLQHLIPSQITAEEKIQKKRIQRKQSLMSMPSLLMPSKNNLMQQQNGVIFRGGTDDFQRSTQRSFMDKIAKANRNGESLSYLQNLWVQRDNNQLSRRIWREVDKQIKDLVVETMENQNNKINGLGSLTPSLNRAINKERENQLQQADVV